MFAVCVFLQISSCGRSSTQTQQSEFDCNCQLAPEGEVFLEKRASSQTNSNPSIPEVRQAVRDKLLREQGEIVEVAKVEDRKIPGLVGEISILIYTPKEDGKFPFILFYHGGGWATGDLDTHDNISRILAKKANAIVVAVDYRLGPEHPFPAALDDAYSALNWVAQQGQEFNGDSSRIALVGDSAGGNLVAAVALKSRD